jgi:5'(3')-deoxyribonucleotidase
MKKIGLDVDGVLADIFGYYCARMGLTMASTCQWTFPGIQDFVDHKMKAYEWENLPMISTPQDIDFDVHCYITALPEVLSEHRNNWLNKNGYPVAPIFYCENKSHIIKRLGLDLFIDDKPSAIERFNQEGINAYQFVPYYWTGKIHEKNIKHLSEVKHL